LTKTSLLRVWPNEDWTINAIRNRDISRDMGHPFRKIEWNLVEHERWQYQ
jgi:hypothetical protein